MIQESKDFPIDFVAEKHVELKKSGSDRMVSLCPFHEERTPSFTLFLSTNTY